MSSPPQITPNTEAAILARMLKADNPNLTPDTARYFLAVRLAASDEDRFNELSAKARAGSPEEHAHNGLARRGQVRRVSLLFGAATRGLCALTEAETRELDSYLHVGFLLGVMQAKARRMLADTPLAQQ